VKEAWLAYDTSNEVTEMESLYNAYLAAYDDQQPWFMNGLYIAGAGLLAGGVGAFLEISCGIHPGHVEGWMV